MLADLVWSFRTAAASAVLWQAKAGSEQTVAAAQGVFNVAQANGAAATADQYATTHATVQAAFAAEYAHAKADWTALVAPLYVVYSRKLATANQTNDAVASLADQTYSNQLAQHQASFVAQPRRLPTPLANGPMRPPTPT